MGGQGLCRAGRTYAPPRIYGGILMLCLLPVQHTPDSPKTDGSRCLILHLYSLETDHFTGKGFLLQTVFPNNVLLGGLHMIVDLHI